VDGDGADGARCDIGAFEFGAAANTPPTISNIPDTGTSFDTPAGPIAFTIGDTETPANSLTVSGTSANQTLVPNGNISFGGGGTSRTVTITPAAGQSGSTTITITVGDGAAASSDSFMLTVNPAGSGSASYFIVLPVVLRQ
jgi:hypothetical protein